MKMVTSYNTKDLIKFGQYLLSKEREDHLRQIEIHNPKFLPYEERKSQVYPVDIDNWKYMGSKGGNITIDSIVADDDWVEVEGCIKGDNIRIFKEAGISEDSALSLYLREDEDLNALVYIGNGQYLTHVQSWLKLEKLKTMLRG